MKININGKDYEARAGQTILQACRDAGVDIPTLCHDERLKPFGSCMLCRVEVEKSRGTMLACGSEINEGMVIRTETDAVRRSRQTCLELLVSQHRGDCKAPCTLACPAHVDIQGYIAHIANGNYEAALKLIKERNPLPVVCGRICTRPCEKDCRRNLLEGPLGIAYLKRFVADIDIEKDVPYLPKKAPATGKKAAVIGAGPAGLSAAWYLAQLGHSVTIFDRHGHGGGMLRYGIPSYRMPRETLDLEIDVIKSLGVDIVYGKDFGRDITLASLKKDGFNSVLLAVGSQVGQPLGIAGEEGCAGVLRGVEFLGGVTEGKAPELAGKKIVVVGGGNTAMDCSRTALRLGAESVKLVYRRTKNEMPADPMEVEEAELEGVEFSMLTNPSAVRSEGGKTVITLVKQELGEPDASGRRAPRPIEGSGYDYAADYVISAIGQTQDLSFLGESCALSTNRNRLVADEATAVTNIAGVFAAGDAVTGPKTAIQAIAGGRTAALSMDKFMRGEAIAAEKQLYNHTKAKKWKELDPAEFADREKIEKTAMPMLTKEQRERNFKEVELGFTEEEALREASRCLSCGCKDVNDCKLREYATRYDVKQEAFAAGSIERHPLDESHPYISRDIDKCIMCGRCVRICTEVQGLGVLGLVGRGYGATVQPAFSTPFGESLDCVKCGQCLSSCPVGALTEKTALKKPGPFEEKVTDTVCTYCGAGCSIQLRTADGCLVRASSEPSKGINHGNLCEKGRFKNDFINSPKRIKTPYIRKNGELAPCSMDEAMAAIKAGLQGITAFYVSGRASNEEAEALASIAAARGSDRVLSYGIDSAAASFIALCPEKLVTSYDEISGADLIVELGCDVAQNPYVLGTAVRRAIRSGVRAIKADALTGEVNAAIDAAERPIVVLAPIFDPALLPYLSFSKAKTLLPLIKCNSRGTAKYLNLDLCGVEARPGSAVIWGEDPVGYGKALPDGFCVVCDLFLTESAQQADVVLPMGSFAENEGTVVNGFGGVQRRSKAIDGVDNLLIIKKLAEALGSKAPALYPPKALIDRTAAVINGADALEL